MAKYPEFLDTQKGPFTNAQFKALPRNDRGDIIELWAAYPFITDAQREQLSEDDDARMYDLDEEMEYLKAEFM
jgi:hypothetical protein